MSKLSRKAYDKTHAFYRQIYKHICHLQYMTSVHSIRQQQQIWQLNLLMILLSCPWTPGVLCFSGSIASLNTGLKSWGG